MLKNLKRILNIPIWENIEIHKGGKICELKKNQFGDLQYFKYDNDLFQPITISVLGVLIRQGFGEDIDKFCNAKFSEDAKLKDIYYTYDNETVVNLHF